ncbi:hypothetical protein M495_24790 [Serratia liquefaciens ATCC 27592]|nr:hypothetical protein M495_24790 [Serratia liquefaciens ATCC 27592]
MHLSVPYLAQFVIFGLARDGNLTQRWRNGEASRYT